jgi:hypothetical protein
MERSRGLSGGEAPDRLWSRRLRWRMRGAWLWPSFTVLTLVDGVLLHRLPFYDIGAGDLVRGVLLAGFANLFCAAVIAPLVGRRLRRRRPDLPRLIANDYAGAVLLCALAAAFLAGGLLHRPAVQAERDDRRASFAAVHEYVVGQAPEYRAGLARVDARRLAPDVYRACVPGGDPRRPLCLLVDTDQRPAGISVDPSRTPNVR